MGQLLPLSQEEQDMNIDDFPENIKKVLPSICKILMPHKSYIAFLLKFLLQNENFFCLITNVNNITETMITLNKQISFYYDNHNKIGTIFLNQKERYIKQFPNTDILIIEILPEDNIEEKYFLTPDININNLNNINPFKKPEIFSFNFQKKGNIVYIQGKIKNVNNNEIIHTINITNELKGSPIFLKDKLEVLGINKGNKKNNSNNYADLILPMYNYFKERLFRIELDNNELYLGEINNNIPNRKGKYYFNNGEIYEGDIINNKFEGEGKYIYENGDYYIGQWKDDLRNGKGILYDKEGYPYYEGDFINDEFEGNGKYYLEEGEYYIGSFNKGFMKGKGIIYYSNDNIKYEGDFDNDKIEGNGKYIWKNGEYYIGQFKNGLNEGKGALYYSNNKIKYEGDFINDKFEGNGKYIYEDEEYYIGQFKNGIKHCKGILYDKNGNIKYEGDFIEGKYEGKGKYIYENGDYYEGEFKNNLCNGKGIEYDKEGNILYEGNWIDDIFQHEKK